METVTHREMRNRSGELLRRVEVGESVQVNNNGRPAALIVPVGRDILDGLLTRGEARPSRRGLEALATLVRGTSTVSTREMIDDARGSW